MAFMDGALDGIAAQRMATRLQTEKELRDSWESQHRIAFLLQHGHQGVLLPSASFADRVQQAIAVELAPEPVARAGRFRWIGISSAAAVAVLSASVVLFGPTGTSPRAIPAQAGTFSALRTPAIMLPQGGDRFILRPVRLFGGGPSRSSEADLLIQRDIQRIWVPGQRRLLSAGQAHRQQAQETGSAAQAGGLLAVGYGYPSGLGLQQTGYGSANGNP